MSPGIDEIRGEFTGLEDTLKQLTTVLGELTVELAEMRAPVGLQQGFIDTDAEIKTVIGSVEGIGVAIDADITKAGELRAALADSAVPNAGGGGALGGGGNEDEGEAGKKPKDSKPIGDSNMIMDFIAVMFGYDSFKEYAAFQNNQVHSSITEKLSGQAAIDEQNRIADMVDALALKFASSSKDLSDAYSFLVTTGMDRKLIDALMPSLAETSTAYNVPVADQAQAVFTLNNVMGIPPEEMQQALATLAYAAKLGHFGVGDFGSYLPGIGAQMSMLGAGGLPGEQTAAAALEVVRRVTGSSEEDATDVRDLLTYMTSPMASRFFDRTKRSQDLLGAPIMDLLEKYHVKPLNMPKYLDDEEAKGIDPLSAMVDYMHSIITPDMTPTDKQFIFSSMFHNQQAAKGMLGLVENYGDFNADKATLAGVTPETVTTDFRTATQGATTDLKLFDENVSELNRDLGAAFNYLIAQPFNHIVSPSFLVPGGYGVPDAAPKPPPAELHITVSPDGKPTGATAKNVPPGTTVRVNQGNVLGAP
ncbi:MAG: phage tail tape measure protein [Rhodospirillales bacterium 20-64-7]|nr:MAG: phage tail tape measure protein [Rhodospirillales bacterium 20-64-7]